MDNMSPQQQQQQDGLSRAGQQDNKRQTKFQSYRRQSAPSLVITKALTRSKTLSRESVSVPVCPETCPLVQSFLTSSERFFLLYGHAQLKTGMQTQDRHLFLFSDVLVIAKAKSANNFKQKVQVRVCETWTAGCMDEVCEGSTNPERSFVMGWPTWNCVALFSSAEQKERWLSLLKSRIKEEKEKEEPKTIPLRVYGKGLNTFAITKTLPVSNWDSANEVIRLALQQFGIIGNVKDFQLWVVSKRDNTPYPLIGHEFPFSIQMSHVKSSAVQGGGCRDAAAPPADRQMAMQVEQMQVYKQCQFILKPRPAEPPQHHPPTDFSQKSFRRRRSLVGWAFWRGSASHLNEPAPAGDAPGRLFGRPLSSVCVDDALPKPVMDMLLFLYHEGCWTRGIFRRSAGARAVRELRESLDGGDSELPLTKEHVFIIAGVFKDFLRRIPGSLLGCEVYEEWMDVLEEEDDEEEQVQDVKRMISRLAKENALLLRHLLAVLHAVQANAQENQMTSFNLSVCIAPSLLWPPGEPCSPETEGQGTKKVCELVRFMIDHCEQILGQEPSAMFGGLPRRRSSEESASESWVYPLTDSSYDSLENELDDSSGGSPGFCRRPLRPKALQSSLDSILTFSDYDQDAEAPAAETSPSLEACRSQRRRRSEPAIAYAARFCPYISAGEEEEEELGGRSNRGGDMTGVVSLSTLSSPDPTNSNLAKPTHLQAVSSKEALHKGALKGCMGLHPNSWLKKDRRLSLTQQESLEEEEKRAGGATKPTCNSQAKPKTSRRGSKDAGDKGNIQNPQQDSPSSPSLLHRTPGGLRFPKPARPPESSLTVQMGNMLSNPGGNVNVKRSEAPFFYKPGRPALSLFRQPKTPTAEDCSSRLTRRRGSEPERRIADQASALTRTRLPSDPGLKPTHADQHARFCLSPCATKAVRDYFSSHPLSNPQSSQEVALALAEGQREWLKRCSDGTAEPDLEQLLFAEESYV
ncbi:PREDICTED: rho GTPase-activating protein 20 isoform X1 [Poecilia mexicana]|uniref:Rho-GAP domain-containing protein n=1 Tax=Poecilia mexicana TaxID=48701 RepID=A0A3B3WVF8_9TELE|nr:PREDICTED: rho GTPase-activating protein 20 isoform X1 [Poecilia mexicana]